MSTFNSYLREVPRYLATEGQAQRIGQAYFNVLHEMNPDLANKVRGTQWDPFYCDDKVPAFLGYAATMWSE